MGIIHPTIRERRLMFNLCHGTDIVLNSHFVSSPAAFHARTTTIAKMLIILNRPMRTN